MYVCMRERERNILFNDALNTFYLRLYGVRHMVKDHSDSEKGNPLPPHRLTARVLLYAPSYRQDNTYHGLCYTSRGALACMYECMYVCMCTNVRMYVCFDVCMCLCMYYMYVYVCTYVRMYMFMHVCVCVYV